MFGLSSSVRSVAWSKENCWLAADRADDSLPAALQTNFCLIKLCIFLAASRVVHRAWPRIMKSCGVFLSLLSFFKVTSVYSSSLSCFVLFCFRVFCIRFIFSPPPSRSAFVSTASSSLPPFPPSTLPPVILMSPVAIASLTILFPCTSDKVQRRWLLRCSSHVFAFRPSFGNRASISKLAGTNFWNTWWILTFWRRIFFFKF